MTDSAAIIPPNTYNKEFAYQLYLQKVAAEPQVLICIRKIHGPGRRTLMAVARHQINEATYQNYLRGAFDHNSSTLNQSSSTTDNAYKPRVTSDFDLQTRIHGINIQLGHPVISIPQNNLGLAEKFTKTRIFFVRRCRDQSTALT